MTDHRERPPRVPVHELADELGLAVRDILAAARELRIDAQNRITKLHPNDAKRLRAHFATKPDVDADSINTDDE